MSKSKSKVGDLIAIPVGAGFGLAKVLFLPKRYKNAVLLGLYKFRSQTPTLPSSLPADFARLEFTDRQPIENGRWKIVGNMALKGKEVALAQPRFIVAGNLWEGDTYMSVATSEQRSNLMQMIVATVDLLENEIRELLGDARLREEEQKLNQPPPALLTLESLECLKRIRRAKTTKPIVESLSAITNGDYLEADECNEALAAAEVVAACRGFPVGGLPDEIAAWCAKHRGLIGSEIISQAEAAINRILRDSELKELWSEGDGGAEWEAAVEDLLHRLASPD